jgi:hypothetical protein
MRIERSSQSVAVQGPSVNAPKKAQAAPAAAPVKDTLVRAKAMAPRAMLGGSLSLPGLGSEPVGTPRGSPSSGGGSTGGGSSGAKNPLGSLGNGADGLIPTPNGAGGFVKIEFGKKGAFDVTKVDAGATVNSGSQGGGVGVTGSDGKWQIGLAGGSSVLPLVTIGGPDEQQAPGGAPEQGETDLFPGEGPLPGNDNGGDNNTQPGGNDAPGSPSNNDDGTSKDPNDASTQPDEKMAENDTPADPENNGTANGMPDPDDGGGDNPNMDDDGCGDGASSKGGSGSGSGSGDDSGPGSSKITGRAAPIHVESDPNGGWGDGAGPGAPRELGARAGT